MYINPALVTMCVAMLMAFIAVGGLLWKLASRLARIEVTLDNHIEDCALFSRPRAQRSGD
jgi:hypothetical protein